MKEISVDIVTNKGTKESWSAAPSRSSLELPKGDSGRVARREADEIPKVLRWLANTNNY